MSLDEQATTKHVRRASTYLSFRLSVVDGRDLGVQREIGLGERIVIGVGPSCDVRLSDPGVSRRHLALAGHEQYLGLTDQRSSNGTEVNGVLLEECALRGGEYVKIGATSIRIDAVTVDRPRPAPLGTFAFGRAVGASASTRALFSLAESLARRNVTAVLEGESGTGKELLAECIHLQSARADRPFVVFEPATIAIDGLAPTLFGIERAGEPGVPGLLDAAQGGTLVIDGPSDIPLDLQRRLLRLVEKGVAQPVGSANVRRYDIRFVALSTENLDRAVEEGRLREDLLHALATARLYIEPLRNRREDARVLLSHFWFQLGGKTEPPGTVTAQAERLAWPGNVRELQSFVAQQLDVASAAQPAVTDGVSPALELATDIERFAPFLDTSLPLPRAKQAVLSAFEAAFVGRLLQVHGGNVSRAAAASGVAHRYFQLLKARHLRQRMP